MATRGRIGIEMPDHSVVSVYCHWDNYPSGTGKTLVQHYLNREDVQELIDGGSMSQLRTRGEWNSNALKDENGEWISDAAGYLMYENDRDPQPLYHTERGEELSIEHTSFDEFVSGNLGGEEYAYLYNLDDNWKCYKIGFREPTELVEIPNYVTA